MKRTERGFAIYTEFVDTYGHEVRVQESSAACYRRCWIFVDKNGQRVEFDPATNQWVGFSAHLSPEQARRVAKALLRFADGR